MRKKKATDRQIKTMAIKQKIFDTAVSLFLKEGYKNVTVNEICEKLGFTKGTFYAHFRSKDQIIMQFISLDNMIFRTELLPKVSAMKPGIDKLLAFGQLFTKHEEEFGKKLLKQSLLIRMENTNKIAEIYPDKREAFKILKELVTEGQVAGEIRDDLSSDHIATMIIYCMRGIEFSWCLPNTKINLEETGMELFEMLLGGLRKAKNSK
jgi:AcrR family transcriptional regulator